MKAKFLTAIFFVVFYLSLNAQVTFQKIYTGSNAYSIEKTIDGGFIIAGYKNESFALNDACLLKTDDQGNIQWMKGFGGENYEMGRSVQQTNDLGYILVGYTESFGAGASDAYLIKTNTNGDTLWTKTYGGIGYDYGYFIRQTNDGGFIITGGTTSFGLGASDVYLIKTNASGDTLWTKTYGGTGTDFGNTVQQCTDGGYIISASTESFGAGQSDIYLIKTNSNGDTLWTKTYGGAYKETENFIQETKDRGFIILGSTMSFGNGGDPNVFLGYPNIFLIKTDSIGTIDWSKIMGNADVDWGRSIKQTNDRGYIIAGVHQDPFVSGFYESYLIKTDSVANIEWAKSYGGSGNEEGNCVQQTVDGGYILVGSTINSFQASYGIYLIKTDSSGNASCNELNPLTNSLEITPIISATETQSLSGGIVNNTNTLINNGGMASTLCSATVISEANNGITEVSLYPNPFSAQATFQTDIFLKNATLTVYNSLGQIVKQIINISGHTVTLFRDHLPSGLYLIRLTQDNKVITEDKLVSIY